MKKILSIFGTRPQFIKLQPVSRAVEEYGSGGDSSLCHVVVNTGQHFDRMLSGIFLEELKIREPDYNLGIREESHCRQIGGMVIDLEEILAGEKPDIVLVYGDTNSTLAGAIASKKMGFRIGHIEAGLRSFNRDMPEEVNRIMVDRISDVLFCPTENAVKNLKNEGYSLKENRYVVHNCGDVMLDTLIFYEKAALSNSKIINELFGKKGENYILVTIHRAENTDDTARLDKILEMLSILSEKKNIIFPVHPRTGKRIRDIGKYDRRRLKMINPVSYLDMLVLMKNADHVLTDSGGVQKEAYLLKKPCITLRKETEWVETLEGGCNVLADADNKKIGKLLERDIDMNCFNSGYFGDGRAGSKIVDIISGLL